VLVVDIRCGDTACVGFNLCGWCGVVLCLLCCFLLYYVVGFVPAPCLEMACGFSFLCAYGGCVLVVCCVLAACGFD